MVSAQIDLYNKLTFSFKYYLDDADTQFLVNACSTFILIIQAPKFVTVSSSL